MQKTPPVTKHDDGNEKQGLPLYRLKIRRIGRRRNILRALNNVNREEKDHIDRNPL